MNKDIEIIEEFFKRDLEFFENFGERAILQNNEIQAIQNLINKNKELDRENQALYESINCDDNTMLARLYQEEKEKNKELEKKQNSLAFKTNNYMNEVLSHNIISKGELKKIREKLSVIADNEYNKYKKSTTTFVNICGIEADIDILLEEK